MKRIAVVQSCYIPWIGYFDLIRRCDLFILYDCVQYTVRDWRNRNCIKTPNGIQWLTIPVHSSRQHRIYDVTIANDTWRHDHWQTISHNYAKAPCFAQYGPKIQRLYEQCTQERLSDINRYFLSAFCEWMQVKTLLVQQQIHPAPDADKTDALIALCKHHQATHYLSGPSARGYLDIARFSDHGIQVEWMDYQHYHLYDQLYPPFTHQVSMVDCLLHLGDQWQQVLKPLTQSNDV
jgi:hypothetical protein